MEGEKKAYPFAIVGFFVTDKEATESFRKDVSPEDVEQIKNLLKNLIFAEGVDIAIAPFVVPPEQVDNTLHELADLIFSPEGKDN
ncbi:hypothetical protein [Persephonella sp.]